MREEDAALANAISMTSAWTAGARQGGGDDAGGQDRQRPAAEATAQGLAGEQLAGEKRRPVGSKAQLDRQEAKAAQARQGPQVLAQLQDALVTGRQAPVDELDRVRLLLPQVPGVISGAGHALAQERIQAVAARKDGPDALGGRGLGTD